MLLFLCSGFGRSFLFGLGLWHYEGFFGQDFFLNFRWDFGKNGSSRGGYFLYDSRDSLACCRRSGRVLSIAEGAAGVEGYSGFLFALNNVTWHRDNVSGDADVSVSDELACLVD